MVSFFDIVSNTYIAIFLFFCILVLIVGVYFRKQMRLNRFTFQRRLQRAPEEILPRKITLSAGIFTLGDLKKNPDLLDLLSWDDFEDQRIKTDLFRIREQTFQNHLYRQIIDTRPEILQRKVKISEQKYRLRDFKLTPGLLKLVSNEEAEHILNNKALFRPRLHSRT